MTLAEYLNNEIYSKIVIVKMTYVDTLGVVQSRFFSDKIVSVPIDLAVSTTKITPDPVIRSIPRFNREFDPMNNEIIIKSSYSLTLLNPDGEYDDFFIDNIFTNQKIEFYVTVSTNQDDSRIELISPFEVKKIAEGVIVEIPSIADTISIKIKDSNVFEKIPTFDFTQFGAGASEDDRKNTKYAVGGLILNHKLTNVNALDTSEWRDYNIETFVSYQSSPGIEAPFFFFRVTTDEKASLLRNLIKSGDQIALVQEGLIDGERRSYEFLEFGLGDNTDFKCSGIPFTSIPGKILIKAETAYLANDTFLVSANKTKAETSSLITTGMTARSLSITLTSNWHWLVPGDIIILRNTDPLYTGFTALSYPVKVKAYDTSTKIVTLEENYAIPTFMSSSYASNTTYVKAYYRYIKSLNINETKLIRDHSYSIIKCQGHDQISSAGKAARLSISNIGTTAIGQRAEELGPPGVYDAEIRCIGKVIGLVANKDSVSYVMDIFTGSETIVRSLNSAGGYHWKVRIKPYQAATGFPLFLSESGTTLSTIKALFDGYTTPTPLPAFNVTINGFGTVFQKAAVSEKYLAGGLEYNTFIKFSGITDPLSSSAPINKRLDVSNKFCIFFKKNGVGSGPGFQYHSEDFVDLVPADTGVETAIKLKNKINTYFPLFSSSYAEIHPTDNTKVVLRQCIESNIPTAAFFTVTLNNAWYTINFDKFKLFDDVISSSEHTIKLNYIGCTLTTNPPSGYLGRLVSGDILFYDTNAGQEIFKRSAQVNNWDFFGKNFFIGSVVIGPWENYIVTDIVPVGDINKANLVFQDNNTVATHLLSTRGNFLLKSKPFDFTADNEVYVEYQDENSSAGLLIKDILDNFLSITNYSQSDLDFFTNNQEYRDNFLSHYKITGGDMMHKIINPILRSFNIACFTDQSGTVRFKHINPNKVTDEAVGGIIYDSEILSFNKEIQDYKAQKVKFKYGKDYNTGLFKEHTKEDGQLTGLIPLTAFNTEKEVETVISKDVFNNEINLIKIDDLLSKKYFIKNQFLEIQVPSTFISDELNKIYYIYNHRRVNEVDQWRLYGIESNLSTITLKLIRLYRADFEIVDEFGNFITDQNGTTIT
jgi:hypothetical protein